MSDYKITTSNLYSVTNETDKLTVTLSRVGAQGSVGSPIVSATLNATRNLLLTLQDGTVIDCGVIPTAYAIGDFHLQLSGGGDLEFSKAGQPIMTLDALGNLKLKGNIDANGI